MLRSILALVVVLFLVPASAAAGVADAVISVDDAKALFGKPNVVFVFTGSADNFAKSHIAGSSLAYAHDMQYLDDVKKCRGLPMCAKTAAAFIGALGIDNNTQVIAYEDGKGVNESGLWFFLNLYGHDKVKLMDGGIGAWSAKDFPVDNGKAKKIAKKTFTAKVDATMIATRADVEDGIKDSNVMLLDARHSFDEYVGKDLKEGMKNANAHISVKRGGHIPSAIYSPWTKYAGNKSGKPDKPIFRSGSKLQKPLKKLTKQGYAADKTLITYCHVGLGRASFQYMGLKLAGHKKVKLYMGSWSEWGNSSLPVETD